LVLEFTPVNDFSNRRIGVRGDFDKINSGLFGELKSLISGKDA
jgi:hypothetical protein